MFKMSVNTVAVVASEYESQNVSRLYQTLITMLLKVGLLTSQ